MPSHQLMRKLRAMRAAVIERYGEPPVLRDVPEPKAEGSSLVEVTAAPLNPVDLSIAGGKFYAGSPPTPYVPGGEGIGRLAKMERRDRAYISVRRCRTARWRSARS